MADTLEQAQTKLQQARDALFKLTVGGATRVIQDQNGERVEFTSSSLTGLRALIRELEWQCAKLGGEPMPLGPMRVIA